MDDCVEQGQCMTKKVNVVQYDMADFLASCVDAYCELAHVKPEQLGKATTPFCENGIARPTASDEEPPGKLKGIASKVLMKILFCGEDGQVRSFESNPKPGIKSHGSGPRTATSPCIVWVSYIHGSKDKYLQGFVGDSFESCQLWLFADADFAGEHDAKSTTGCANGPGRTEHLFPAECFQQKADGDIDIVN